MRKLLTLAALAAAAYFATSLFLAAASFAYGVA